MLKYIQVLHFTTLIFFVNGNYNIVNKPTNGQLQKIPQIDSISEIWPFLGLFFRTFYIEKYGNIKCK